MSIVEQAVDSIKTEESIGEICASHEDVLKVVSKELSVGKDLDTMTTLKTEKQTNGSASTIKETATNESNVKSETEPLKPANDVAAEPVDEKMDVDVTAPNANGNGFKDDDESLKKNGEGGEADDKSGESKTGNDTSSNQSDNEKKLKTAEIVKTSDEPKDTINVIENVQCKDELNKIENEIDIKMPIAQAKNDDIEMSDADEKLKVRVSSEICDEIKKDVLNEKNDNETKEKDTEMKNEEPSCSKDIKEKAIDAEIEVKLPEDDNTESSKNQKAITENVENAQETVNDKLQPLIEADIDNAKIRKNTEENTKDELEAVSDRNGTNMNREKVAEEKKDKNDCPTATSETEKAEQNKIEKESVAMEVIAEPILQANGNTDKIEKVTKQSNGIENAEILTENVVKEVVLKDNDLSCSENNSSSHKQIVCDRNSSSKNVPNNDDHEMTETNSEEKADPETKSEIKVSEIENQQSDDHEMVDVAEKEEATSKEEPVTEEPLNQSIYVDENRYFESGTMLELSRISWCSQNDKQQYVRGCLWSPDGTCILTAVNMDGMHVINLPTDLYSNQVAAEDRPVDKLESVIHVKEGGTVYDYCWYPFMNSTMPESCCWLSTRQHCPIQLWDGFTGELRGSYRGYDNVDEVEAAFSVTFTSDAEKVIGGYKKSLKIFDTKSPGREYSIIPIKQPCSCFAVQEAQCNIIATGSWNASINLYDLRTPKLGSLVTLEKHTGGVTFLKFNASADSLFSGARKDNSLLEWDMRNFSTPLRELNRTVRTNQRIYFDLSPGEKWLASGDGDGLVRVWDVKSQDDIEEFSFELHKDCCNGISFHPSRSMLATCAGQYHFHEDIDDENATSQPREEIYENSLIFWWIGEMSKGKEKDSTPDNPITKKETADKEPNVGENMET